MNDNNTTPLAQALTTPASVDPNDGELICPRCRYLNLHPSKNPSLPTTVLAPHIPSEPGDPFSQSTYFWCEGCWTFDMRLDMFFHKGTTYVKWATKGYAVEGRG